MSDAAPARTTRRVYTGWRIVGANSVVWSLQSMIWVQGYGNMAVELRDQFGWSKSFLSFVYAGTRAETAVFGPIQGRAIGQAGIKKVMRTGAVLGLIGFLTIAWADTKVEFVIAMLILALATGLDVLKLCRADAPALLRPVAHYPRYQRQAHHQAEQCQQHKAHAPTEVAHQGHQHHR